MRKVLVIASREYVAAVRTKAFLVSLLVMPLMMGGSILLQLLLKDQVDTTEKRVAVVDRTPGQKLVEALEKAARERNQQGNPKGIFDSKTGKQTRPVYAIERVEPSTSDAQAINQQRYDLSERVRAEKIYGFLEIAPDVLQSSRAGPGTPNAIESAESAQSGEPTGSSVIRYQSEHASADDFPNWAERILTTAIEENRASQAGLSESELKKILQKVPLVSKGLSKRNAQTGEIEEAVDQNQIATLLVPGGLMMLMFMLVMLGATPLMSGVLEEKMQRIAEVMLGSVHPFQLMLGKLIGIVGVSLTLSAIYLGGAYWAAYRYGYASYFPTDILVWFFIYQMLAVLMFGSLFIAIGAACTDARETQTMIWPVMLLICLPMFVWLNVIREPTSSFATGVSLIPFATPMLMLARQAVPPGIPWWQPALGVVLVLITTTFCVYAAGRIFRVGLLMQGKGANFGEMLKWVFRG